MQIEMLTLQRVNNFTGIGRYISNLTSYMPTDYQIIHKRVKLLPLAKHWTFLQSLPIGIHDHQPGNIVHFPQIMGCNLMLWRPIHPAIATVHDLGSLELTEERQMLDPIARAILSLSLAGLRKMDLLVTVSEFTRQSLIRHLGIHPDRVRTVLSGIDPLFFHVIKDARQTLLKKYKILAPPSSPWLLYVGSELPRKNLSGLLKALALARQGIPEIMLLKVGSAGGENFRKTTLDIIKELHLDKNVVFIDNVPDEDLIIFYNSCDIFVTASRLEGFSFPVLEAMACGTPVICSNTTALLEIGQEAAYFVSPDDPKSLAQAILFVINDETTRQTMVQNGLHRAQTFRWERSSEQMAQLYSELVKC